MEADGVGVQTQPGGHVVHAQLRPCVLEDLEDPRPALSYHAGRWVRLSELLPFHAPNLHGGRSSRVGSGQEICVASWHLGQENHNHQRQSRKWLITRARDRRIKPLQPCIPSSAQTTTSENQCSWIKAR